MSVNKEKQNAKQDDFIMLPIVDVCFDELMHNEKIRRGIISSLLHKDPEEIEETELLPTHLQREYADDKLGIMDVRICLKDKTKINFEMQVATFAFWSNRILFYLSKMYTEQIQAGDSYEELKKCVHVSILDFIHFPQDERWYHKISLCDMETGDLYTDLLELHVFELKKLPPEKEDEEGIIRWMRFFGSRSRKELEEMAGKDEYIDEAYEELKKLSADEMKRIEYEQRQKAFRDHKWMTGCVERAEKELDAKRKELEETEKELEGTQKELEGAQKELEGAQKELAETKKEVQDEKLREMQRGIKNLIATCEELGIEESIIKHKIMEKYTLGEKEAEAYFQR